MRREIQPGYELDDDRERIDVAAVHRFLSEEAYWALGRPFDTVALLVRNSYRVLGLYQRLGRESQITLYRRPIIRAAGSRETLRRQIHGTLLHELGHLFGMTEEDLDHYQIGNHPLPGAALIRESEISG